MTGVTRVEGTEGGEGGEKRRGRRGRRRIRNYDSIATVGEIRVYRRADFQSGSRVLKKVF